MAMASILGLSVVEVFDRRTVAAEKIGPKNKKYQQLLHYCDLPSIKDMAITDAKSLIVQLEKYETNFLQYDFNDDGPVVTGVMEDAPDILTEVFDLSLEEVTVRDYSKQPGLLRHIMDLRKIWGVENDVPFFAILNGKQIKELQNIYWTRFRLDFDCLDPNYRLKCRMSPGRPVVTRPVRVF